MWVQHRSDRALLLHLALKSSAVPSLQFSCLHSHARFCHARKAWAESIPPAGNMVIPSCFSFAYLKGSSLSYWAINRKTPWLHLWLLLCRSNITDSVIAPCIQSLRKKKNLKPKQQVPEFSRRVATCPLHYSKQVYSFDRLSKFHYIKSRVERKKITRATTQDKREDKAEQYKG